MGGLYGPGHQMVILAALPLLFSDIQFETVCIRIVRPCRLYVCIAYSHSHCFTCSSCRPALKVFVLPNGPISALDASPLQKRAGDFEVKCAS